MLTTGPGMAVATGPVGPVLTGPLGPVSTGPLFGGKVMNIRFNHALNCLFRAHAINLRRRRGRHVVKFALMAAKEPLEGVSTDALR